jgi:hypothetical protein
VLQKVDMAEGETEVGDLLKQTYGQPHLIPRCRATSSKQTDRSSLIASHRIPRTSKAYAHVL